MLCVCISVLKQQKAICDNNQLALVITILRTPKNSAITRTSLPLLPVSICYPKRNQQAHDSRNLNDLIERCSANVIA